MNEQAMGNSASAQIIRLNIARAEFHRRLWVIEGDDRHEMSLNDIWALLKPIDAAIDALSAPAEPAAPVLTERRILYADEPIDDQSYGTIRVPATKPEPASASNALRPANPLSKGKCTHGVSMAEHCPSCASAEPASAPSEGHDTPSFTLGMEDFKRGFKTNPFQHGREKRGWAAGYAKAASLAASGKEADRG